MNEDDATSVVGTNETTLGFDQPRLSVVLATIIVVVLVIFRIFLCWDVEGSHETVFKGKQNFREMMIVEGVDYFFLAFVVAIELERFCS